eukprot:TRINITY_DN9444_c0_g1_i1.p1 TRINITY_DN9444_c0_g1~~TRINITY_DN9444_c0_g1_i1.p1  ORF type:complete len:426 (+),score=34.22 TRINITY_DN9444_c0_g1_i1:244-1521(+)
MLDKNGPTIQEQLLKRSQRRIIRHDAPTLPNSTRTGKEEYYPSDYHQKRSMAFPREGESHGERMTKDHHEHKRDEHSWSEERRDHSRSRNSRSRYRSRSREYEKFKPHHKKNSRSRTYSRSHSRGGSRNRYKSRSRSRSRSGIRAPRYEPTPYQRDYRGSNHQDVAREKDTGKSEYHRVDSSRRENPRAKSRSNSRERARAHPEEYAPQKSDWRAASPKRDFREKHTEGHKSGDFREQHKSTGPERKTEDTKSNFDRLPVSYTCFLLGMPLDAERDDFARELKNKGLLFPNKIVFVKGEDEKGYKCNYLMMNLDNKEVTEKLLRAGLEVLGHPALVIEARDNQDLKEYVKKHQVKIRAKEKINIDPVVLYSSMSFYGKIVDLNMNYVSSHDYIVVTFASRKAVEEILRKNTLRLEVYSGKGIDFS